MVKYKTLDRITELARAIDGASKENLHFDDHSFSFLLLFIGDFMLLKRENIKKNINVPEKQHCVKKKPKKEMQMHFKRCHRQAAVINESLLWAVSMKCHCCSAPGCTVVTSPGATISENAVRDDFAFLMKPL